jgi:hypothetical protein
MPKLKINERTVESLQLDLNNCRKERQQVLHENDSLRNTHMMVCETLRALTEDKSYWSEEAVKSGIVWRLENVLKQIENN